MCCDIAQPDQVAAMVAATKDKFCRLDYAFNNAGISGTAAPVHAMPLEVRCHEDAASATAVARAGVQLQHANNVARHAATQRQ